MICCRKNMVQTKSLNTLSKTYNAFPHQDVRLKHLNKKPNLN